MYKNIIIACLLSLAFLLPNSANACDACGCGVGSYQFGILPQQTKNFAGIRYQTKSDKTTPHHDLQTTETFHTAEIWGRFYPVKRVMVMALVPYSFNEQTVGEKTTAVKGLGDVVVLANYNLLNNTDSLYQKVKHNLFVGGGVKLATGNYRLKTEGSDLNPNLQLGSGSFDVIANAIYTIRYNKIGLNNDVSFKLNSSNKDHFRFGNRMAASTRLFSVVKIKESALMPNVGLSFERNQKDEHFGHEIKESGGYANFLTLGTEAYYKNLSCGLTFQKPVSQKLSAGHVKTGNRLMSHVTFMF